MPYLEITWEDVTRDRLEELLQNLEVILGEERVLIIDNAPAHRWLESVGENSVNKPPYSPSLNPFEICFSKSNVRSSIG